MNEREKILEERRAYYKRHITEILGKYMPNAQVINIRQCWTPGWDAELADGNVVHFDHVSYFDSSWKYVIDYYFQDRKTLKKVVYERR